MRTFISLFAALLLVTFVAIPAFADHSHEHKASGHDHHVDVEIDTEEFEREMEELGERLSELGERIGEQVGRAFEDMDFDFDIDIDCDEGDCEYSAGDRHHVKVEIGEAVEIALEVAMSALENLEDIHIEFDEERLEQQMEELEEHLEDLEERLERKFEDRD